MHARLFRALAIALLVVTIPIQGFGAVTAGMSMALGDHDGAATQATDMPGHEGMPGHEEGHGGHAPCVACWAATAITPFVPLVLSGAAASPLAAPPAVSFHSVAPHRLDRPPLAA